MVLSGEMTVQISETILVLKIFSRLAGPKAPVNMIFSFFFFQLQWAAAVWATSAAFNNNLILETWDMDKLHTDRKLLFPMKQLKFSQVSREYHFMYEVKNTP